ncbi:hypothetical protein N4235_11060 [Enterobacter asburiae]|uniref:hypothetical protein n=1 Tax=Enterobacter asburiae TaxID=61645 RepID=UPI0029669E86|nr:hypothetical protein [Enterobacter asburiae]MDW3571445.1 hypothetical protein [Enterobacter asburiae]
MENHRGLKNIPSLDYCRIARASEILGCSIDDIIYWAGEGKIRLCVKLYDAKGKLLIPAISDPEKTILFLLDLMNTQKVDDFIHDGNAYIKGYPLINIFPEKLFFPENEDDLTDFAMQVFKGDGFPVSVDGLWELEANHFPFYDFDNPPVIGGISEEMQMASKVIELLGMDIEPNKLLIIKNTSFKANPADTDGEIGDYVFMAGVQARPISLSINNLYITKKYIADIHDNLMISSISHINGERKPTKVTAKQSTFTVALMKKVGITDDDLKGSITELRRKLVRLIPEAPVPDDDKSLIDWLRKGGVDR